MYKNLSDRLVISTRRNKTESKYLSNFINWCEDLTTLTDAPVNLLQLIHLLNKHKDIKKLDLRIRKSGRWIPSGSISTVQLEILNKAYKLSIVTFIQSYDPGELNKESAKKYIQMLESEISLINLN